MLSLPQQIEPYTLVRNSFFTPLNGTFLAYETRLFAMGDPLSGSPSALYHSNDVAGVHVVMLASYARFEAGSPQFLWLEADLKSVDRRKTPWVIVGMHVSLVSKQVETPGCTCIHATSDGPYI